MIGSHGAQEEEAADRSAWEIALELSPGRQKQLAGVWREERPLSRGE